MGDGFRLLLLGVFVVDLDGFDGVVVVYYNGGENVFLKFICVVDMLGNCVSGCKV